MEKLARPLHRPFPVSSDYQAHLDRSSTAPGVDWAAPGGEPVFAAETGLVEVAEGRGDGGLRVWLNHGRLAEGGSVVKTYYAHLSSLEVVKGWTVPRGYKLGEVGRTGNATGYCLHLSVKVGGQYTNPEPLLEEV